MFIIRN